MEDTEVFNTVNIDGKDITFTVKILNHETTKSVTLPGIANILNLYSTVCTETGVFTGEIILPLLVAIGEREITITTRYIYAIKTSGKTPTSYSESKISFSIAPNNEVNEWIKDEDNKEEVELFMKVAKHIGAMTVKDGKRVKVRDPIEQLLSLDGKTIH